MPSESGWLWSGQAGSRGSMPGRLWALSMWACDRNTQGEVVATSAMASPCTAMCAGFFAFQPARFMCAALFFCPFSGGALIPLLRSPSSASDGPSGEAAGMEANKRRLTLDLASTLQRWLKVWRSRASACAGAVKPPSTGRPTEGEADTRFSAAPCAIANTRRERLQDDMDDMPSVLG